MNKPHGSKKKSTVFSEGDTKSNPNILFCLVLFYFVFQLDSKIKSAEGIFLYRQKYRTPTPSAFVNLISRIQQQYLI